MAPAGYHKVLVRVSDDGNGRLSAKNYVIIQVIQSNRRPTIYNKTIYVEEKNYGWWTRKVGSPVEASDPDVNPVQRLSFRIESGNEDRCFSINAYSGQIRTRRSYWWSRFRKCLNYENVKAWMNSDPDRPAEATGQWYRLKVSVTDSGAGRMSDVANIYIVVKNRNDYPYFERIDKYRSWYIDVPESMEVGASIMTNFVAKDEDEDTVLKAYTYSWDRRWQAPSTLTLGEPVQIRLVKKLNYEERRYSWMSIKSSDNGVAGDRTSLECVYERLCSSS